MFSSGILGGVLGGLYNAQTSAAANGLAQAQQITGPGIQGHSHLHPMSNQSMYNAMAQAQMSQLMAQQQQYAHTQPLHVDTTTMSFKGDSLDRWIKVFPILSETCSKFGVVISILKTTAYGPRDVKIEYQHKGIRSEAFQHLVNTYYTNGDNNDTERDNG